VPLHSCCGPALNHDTDPRISSGGLRLDETIEQEFRRALSPGAIEAALISVATAEDARVAADFRSDPLSSNSAGHGVIPWSISLQWSQQNGK